MKTILKHKRTHKDRIKANEQSEADQRHDKLRNSALMEYYLMGGH